MSSTYSTPKEYENRPVVLLGGGVLGRRIAACFAAGGWNVRIRDPSAAQREAAVDYIQQNIGTYTAITRRKSGSWEAVEDLPLAVKDAWLVIEAVPEKLEIKLSTFADLEKYTPKDCILATNSSSYKSGELVARVSDETKTRVLNTHFMMPPHALIVELMTDGHTHPEIFPFMTEQLKIAGLHPIVALRESTGFVFNRIWAAIKRETMKVLAEGVSTPSEIDRVFKEQYGAREGPCHMMDNVGLDTVENIENHYITERRISRSHLNWLHENYIVPGKLGNKSDKGGFYPPPTPGSRTVLYFLNIGMAERLEGTESLHEIMHRGQLLSYEVDSGSVPTEISGHDAMPDGIDIHHASRRMFWTEMGSPKANDGIVYSAELDGSDRRVVVKSGDVHTPKECVIDQEAQKLYFCDREGLRVMRVNLDGSDLETLIQTGDWKNESESADQDKWCVGIAVSRKLNKIYWTQKSYSKAGTGKLFSAGLEIPKGSTASNRKDIETLMSDLPEPIDLEIDDEEGVLYWTDRGELPLGNTLNKKHLIGETPAAEKKYGRQILAQGFGEAIGVRLDKKNDVLWVADIVGRIWKCDPHRPSLKEKVYESEWGAFTGLAVLHL